MADETPPPDPAADAPPRRRGRDRVVALPKPAPPVFPEVLSVLSEITQQAERGEIAELVVVYCAPDGSTGWQRTSVSYMAAVLGELRLVGDELSEEARSD